ncbi:MAG TPA: hypothetical protein PK867_31730, partial [Pirellulales bacterium]|nr:hypothetical protein [Pirellulales bacterium]
RWLLGLISFLAIGCGLLFYARPVPTCIIFAGTLLVLFAAVPLSVYRRGECRPFWFGFALFGFGYLGLVCGPWQAPDVHLQIGVRERLPTTKLLEAAYKWVPTRPASPAMGGGMFGQMGMGGMGPAMPRPNPREPITDWSDFVIVGHSLWALLLAVAGACSLLGVSERGGFPDV